VSFSCGQARALWNAYSEETLATDERRAMREHLGQCRSCRDEAASIDASLIFSAAPAVSVSDEDVARVLAGVRAGVALKRAERRIARRPVRTWASVAVLVALAILLPGNRAGRRSAPPAVPSAASAAVQVPMSPAASPEVGAAPKTSLPASATVYDWNMDSGQPRVVWIVDRSLDI
jgi:predicted anti-sigma-YlaC factor YlaD